MVDVRVEVRTIFHDLVIPVAKNSKWGRPLRNELCRAFWTGTEQAPS